MKGNSKGEQGTAGDGTKQTVLTEDDERFNETDVYFYFTGYISEIAKKRMMPR